MEQAGWAPCWSGSLMPRVQCSETHLCCGSAGRQHSVQILRQQEILTLKMQSPLILTIDDYVLKTLVREELNKI